MPSPTLFLLSFIKLIKGINSLFLNYCLANLCVLRAFAPLRLIYAEGVIYPIS